MSNRRIVVSIDFGTTYSGVAWADTTRVSVVLTSLGVSLLTLAA